MTDATRDPKPLPANITLPEAKILIALESRPKSTSRLLGRLEAWERTPRTLMEYLNALTDRDLIEETEDDYWRITSRGLRLLPYIRRRIP